MFMHKKLKISDNEKNIGLFSLPAYERAEQKTLVEYTDFLIKITKIIWSLYRMEWWYLTTSYLSKRIKINIPFRDFPSTLIEVNQLIQKTHEISPNDSEKLVTCIVAKQEIVSSLGKCIVFNRKAST